MMGIGRWIVVNQRCLHTRTYKGVMEKEAGTSVSQAFTPRVSGLGDISRPGQVGTW